MRIYLAAPYSQKEQMQRYAAELQANDIIVTSSWLAKPHAPETQMKDLTSDQHRAYAMQDIKDVQAADILVFFTDQTKTIVRGGRHVEFGIAVQRRIPIYVIGDFENIFHYLPRVIHFKKWATVRNMLIALSRGETDIVTNCQ